MLLFLAICNSCRKAHSENLKKQLQGVCKDEVKSLGDPATTMTRYLYLVY